MDKDKLTNVLNKVLIVTHGVFFLYWIGSLVYAVRAHSESALFLSVIMIVYNIVAVKIFYVKKAD